MSNLLKFEPFTSSVNISFWYELAELKLDKFKLSEDPIKIKGYYTISTNHSVPSRFSFIKESFDDDFKYVKAFIIF